MATQWFLIRDIESGNLHYLNIRYLTDIEDIDPETIRFVMVNGNKFSAHLRIDQFAELVGLHYPKGGEVDDE